MENVIRTITMPWKILATFAFLAILVIGVQITVSLMIEVNTVVEERASCTLVSIEPKDASIYATFDCDGHAMGTGNPKMVYALIQDPSRPIFCKIMAREGAGSCELLEPEKAPPEG